MTAIDILGVAIDDATYGDMLDLVDEWVESGLPHQIVTVNPEMLVAAHDDPAFRRVLRAADLKVADGVGVILAARLLGTHLGERVTGSDGIYRLAAHAAQRGYRPFLLGAAPGVAEAASARLSACYPALAVAGTWAGSPHPADEETVIAQVRAAAPELLLVAWGVPAEEMWIARNRQRLGVPVMIGVGGAFDFVAGVARRAPPWMQQLGIEWLYRLFREPWRWRRQLALPRFVLLVVRQKLKESRGR